MDGLLIAEVCSYIRAVWGRSNRSLSLIYSPAPSSIWVHKCNLTASITTALQQEINAYHILDTVRARIHAQKRTQRVFTLTKDIYLHSLVLFVHQMLFELCPVGFAVSVNPCGFRLMPPGSLLSVIFKIGAGPGKGWFVCFCFFSCRWTHGEGFYSQKVGWIQHSESACAE